MMYNPGPNGLVPFRGRCPFRQNIPSKPAKYGINIWAACDSKTSHAWQNTFTQASLWLDSKKRTRGCAWCHRRHGHTIFCDNFFTSHALSQELLKRRLTMVETITKIRQNSHMPCLQQKTELAFRQCLPLRRHSPLFLIVREKGKTVLLLSTLHREASVSSRDDKKPQIILDDNKSKGGEDNLDMVFIYFLVF